MPCVRRSDVPLQLIYRFNQSGVICLLNGFKCFGGLLVRCGAYGGLISCRGAFSGGVYGLVLWIVPAVCVAVVVAPVPF